MATSFNLPADFPDRISPMLVKELRQGLRAKTFIVVFLGLQGALGTMLLAATAAAYTSHVGGVLSGIIFTFFAVAVIVIQPLRGIAAVSSEIRGNTIDMMVLTRLSARRILFGKWVALVSQSALLLATIVPYLILRYFFGGMNLLAEMVLLALIFITSMSLTAVAVGVSAIGSIIVRAIFPLLGVPVLLWTLAFLSFGPASRSGGLLSFTALEEKASIIGVPVYILAMIYLGWSALSLGTSLIAPAAENHATLRRLISLALAAAIIPIAASGEMVDSLLPLVYAIIIAPAVITALSELPPNVSPAGGFFKNSGPSGKIASLFLAPGWPAGVLFTALLAMIAAFAYRCQSGHHLNQEVVIISLSLFGWLLFPAAVMTFTHKGEGQRIGIYIMLLAATAILTGILAMLAAAMNDASIVLLFVWNPLTFLILMNQLPAPHDNMIWLAAFVNLILLLIPLVKGLPALRGTRPIDPAPDPAAGPESP